MAAPVGGQASYDASGNNAAVPTGNTASPTVQSNDLIRRQEVKEVADVLLDYLKKHKNNAALQKNRTYSSSFKLIDTKYKNDQYSDVWEFLQDIYDMFYKISQSDPTDPKESDSKTQAPIKTRSKTMQATEALCWEVKKDFEKTAEKRMKSRNYCCGVFYYHCLHDLNCWKNQCIINVNDEYYKYEDKLLCTMCFKESKNEVVIIDDDASEKTFLKSNFKSTTNDSRDSEPLIKCTECERRFHTICIGYIEDVQPFLCDTCLKAKGKQRKENTCRAKALPKSKLAEHMEKRVNDYCEKNKVPLNVIVRVLNCSHSIRDVDKKVRKYFPDMPENFLTRIKAVFAFVEEQGRDRCFFGMYVDEYKEYCDEPNKRRVYLSYFDSSLCPSIKPYRRNVYFQLLIGYLDYIRSTGYKSCHLWSCPPQENKDYIFNCHPIEQRKKSKSSEDLRKWYDDLIEEAKQENVVLKCSDYITYFSDNNYDTASKIPYFGEDPWSYKLQEVIDQRKASAKVTQQVKSKINRDALQNLGEFANETLVIELNTSTIPQDVDDIDEYTECDFISRRETFVMECKKNHWEFCSDRRALHSTMVFLQRVFAESSVGEITCNECTEPITIYYHCSRCKDFDLCERCYTKIQHPHPMEKIGAETSGDTDGADQKEQSSHGSVGAQSPDAHDIVKHALFCTQSNCKVRNCTKIKQLLKHIENCKDRSRNCRQCTAYIQYGSTHGKNCVDMQCQVPLCNVMKNRVSQQKQQADNEQRQITQFRATTRQSLNKTFDSDDDKEEGVDSDPDSCDNSSSVSNGQ